MAMEETERQEAIGRSQTGRFVSGNSLFPVQFSSYAGTTAGSALPGAVSSLFPVAASVDAEQGSEPPQSWLSNSSFAESLLPLRQHGDGEGEGEKVPADGEGATQSDGGEGNEKGRIGRQPTSSSSSSDMELSAEEEKGEMQRTVSERRRRREKKKRKRKREEEERRKRKERKRTGDDSQIGSLEGLSLQRKTTVKVWADGKAKPPKEYYFDTRGDRDNLAFGSIYRMDIARYHLLRSGMGLEQEEVTRKRKTTGLDDVEADGFIPEKTGSRYWSTEAAAREKQRDFKRIRVHSVRPDGNANPSFLFPEEFIPVDGPRRQKKGEEEMEVETEGESWEDYVQRRTREFNTSTRERPQDESVWLAFVQFQDELIQATPKKGAKQQAIDKKISILEKALELHGESEELTLLYLQTCSLRDPIAGMLIKWEDSVVRFSGSYSFWKAFLRFHSSQFSIFSVSSLRSLFVRALRALAAARDRLLHGKGQEELDRYKGPIEDAERAMVAMLADRCHFELHTGHTELAVGLYQAAIEYSLFAPPIQLNEVSKRRLFEAFWDSQAQRVGEEGALGWATWLEQEEEQILGAQSHEAQEAEEQPGGWTGWSEQPATTFDSSRQMSNEGAVMVEAADEGEEIVDGDTDDEDEAALLAKLGLSSIDAGKELEVTDVSVWQRWAEEERLRGVEQCFPVHAQMGNTEERDEELERMVVFEDVRQSLFSMTSELALCNLIGHFLEFADMPLPNWCSSNESSTKERLEGLESLTGSIWTLLETLNIKNASEHVVDPLSDNMNSHQCVYGGTILRSLVGGLEWFRKSNSRANFVHNVLLLLQTHGTQVLSKSHWGLTQGLLSVQGGAAEGGALASKPLVKKLLKTYRQDLALWAAYARVEGAAGHMETARKVFDTTLASLMALPAEAQNDAPLLYLAYADMEVSHGCISRALDILCYFGSGTPYSASVSINDQPIPAPLILKARLGFQHHLQNVRRSHTYVRDTASYTQDRSGYGGALDERAVTVVACVALFEELTSGWEAAISVFEDSLAFTLPEKRKQSRECEALMERYIAMMERSMPGLKPALVRRTVLRGFLQYPYNPSLLAVYVRTTASTYRLRRFFDDSFERFGLTELICLASVLREERDRHSHRNPSTMLWLFALSTELGREKGSAGARIRSLLERALETRATQQSVLLWRIYLAYEFEHTHNAEAARRVYLRAIHACPWSKTLWLDGFTRLSAIMTTKELSEFQEIMRDKELRLRTDVYEILLQDAENDEAI